MKNTYKITFLLILAMFIFNSECKKFDDVRVRILPNTQNQFFQALKIQGHLQAERLIPGLSEPVHG